MREQIPDHAPGTQRPVKPRGVEPLAPGRRTLAEGPAVQRRAATPGRADLAGSGAGPAPIPGAASGDPRPMLHALFGVQRAAGGDAEDAAAVHAVAARGIATSATQLPYAAQIQRAFGRHDISGIQAHVGPDAAASARGMGAQAYATGDHVVLGEGTDMHTVAHEAAHVVQQRGGVQLKGGVGEAGDQYERHADAVADLAVRGESAEALLDQHAGPASSASRSAGPTSASARGALQLKLKPGDAVGLYAYFSKCYGHGAAFSKEQHQVLVNKHDSLLAARQELDELMKQQGVKKHGAPLDFRPVFVGADEREPPEDDGSSSQQRTPEEAVESRAVVARPRDTRGVTAYPTKQDGEPEPWAIPTGTETQDAIAAIFGELEKAGPKALKTKKDEEGERIPDSDRTEGYMVGVVLMDDGKLYATCSGAMPPAFAAAAKQAGAVVVDERIDKATATKLVRKGLPRSQDQDKESGGAIAHHGGKMEHGAPAGACAASKLIWSILERHRGMPVQMTEKLFAPEGGPRVAIFDANGKEQHYQHDCIVPSCITCQAFLSELLPEVREQVAKWRLEAARAEKSSKRMAEEAARNRVNNEKERADQEGAQKLSLLIQVAAELEKLLREAVQPKKKKKEDKDKETIDSILEDGVDGVAYWLKETRIANNLEEASLQRLEELKNDLIKGYLKTNKVKK